MAACELDAKTRAVSKAQAALDLDQADQKLIDRRDRAGLALDAAQKAFDKAWAALHTIAPIVDAVAEPVAEPIVDAVAEPVAEPVAA